MILGKVKGTVTATLKHPVYKGKKVLVIQTLDYKLMREQGQSFLAVDSVQAGVGDIVLVAREGSTARQILGSDTDPFHSVVLGIVDEVDHESSK